MWRPLGMKFYNRLVVPGRVQEQYLHRRARFWNRHKYQGGRIERVIADPDGIELPRWRPSPPAGSRVTATIPADRPTSWSRRTGRCWWPMTGTGAIYRIAYTK